MDELKPELKILDTASAVDELLVIVATAFILLMQAGFALVENGTVRSKNSKNILIKNLFDACAGAVAFWLLGYGFAFGHKELGGFIGSDGAIFAASKFDELEDNYYLAWIFQFSFAATSATIVSGSLAERTQLPAYMAFSVLMTGFIYPVVVGWCWGGGWLGDSGGDKSRGFHDFAGTGIVHMVGGVAGFCGALVIGPRHGKEKNRSDMKDVATTKEFKELRDQQASKAAFEEWIKEMSNDRDFDQNSYPFVVFGTILLWVSWLFFNGGSAFGMFSERRSNPPKIIMVTILSAVAGGLTAAFLKPIIMRTYTKKNRYDVGALSNGILAGLVAITGVCDRCEPYSAFVIGIIGGIVYSLACRLNKALNVDDPIEASQVHGYCGIWGLLAVGIFDNQLGLVSDSPDKGKYFGWQILGMLVIVAWTAAFSLIYFLLMKKFNLLRVSLLDEIIGLDIAEMGSHLGFQTKIDDSMTKTQVYSYQRKLSVGGQPQSPVTHEPETGRQPIKENRVEAIEDVH